jgi:hypothetical protein
MTTEAKPMTEAEAIAGGWDQPVPASRALRPTPVRVIPIAVNVLETDRPSTQPARVFVHVVENFLPLRGAGVRVELNLDDLSARCYRIADDGTRGDPVAASGDLITSAIMAAGSDTIEKARILMGGKLAGAQF